MNSGNAVGSAVVLEDGFDLKAQDFPFFGAFGFKPFLPRVKSTFTHLERPAHDFKIELLSVLEDEFEFQRVSLAKKASAFFRMSRS